MTKELKKEVNADGKKVYNGKYVLEKTISSNSLCAIKLASGTGENSAQKFALKVFKKGILRSKKEYFRKKGGHGMEMRDQLMKVNESEVRTILKLHEETGGHANLVKLHEIIDDDNLEDKLVLVMEYCSQGQLLTWDTNTHKFIANPQLADATKPEFLPENTIKRVILDVAAGLKYMHDKGTLHRDIKPQNILVESGVAKIVDFGVSKVLDDPADDSVKATEGTYHFMPPEECDPDIDQFSGKAVDVWALGVTLFCLLYNKVPFWGDTEFQIMEIVRTQELQIPPPEYREVSEDLLTLLKGLMEKDVSKRLSLD